MVIKDMDMVRADTTSIRFDLWTKALFALDDRSPTSDDNSAGHHTNLDASYDNCCYYMAYEECIHLR